MKRTLTVPIRRLLPLAALTLVVGACNLSKPYPAKQLYAIDAGAPERFATGTKAPTLRVQPVQVTRPFSEEMFHYRVGPARFEVDYYANFVDEPGRLITAELVEWLAATQEFEAVVNASSTIDASRSVQLVINELYADQSDPLIKTRAVVAARVFLLDESKVETKVLLTRDYRETEGVRGEGGDALAKAWGAALGRIFMRIAEDIRTVG